MKAGAYVGRQIELRGVEVHNLKKVNLDIPHRKLIALCGVSGSGKTSLALDTLYAEGQRRYIESFSIYTRQFLQRLEKPAAERIDGLPAAVAVARESSTRSNRSTIGTATETNDYLRLLYAKIGELFCIQCEQPVRRETPNSAAQKISRLPSGTKFMIAFPRSVSEGESLSGLSAELRERGFVRAILEGKLVDLASDLKLGTPTQSRGHGTQIDVVVDRLVASDTIEKRLLDSLETAFAQGSGVCCALVEANEAVLAAKELQTQPRVTIDGRDWLRIGFAADLRCLPCDLTYAEPEPRRFSFNSPLGACPQCEGNGNTIEECSLCHGARLNADALAWRVGGRNIAEMSSLKIDDALAFFQSLELSAWQKQVGRTMLEQVNSRLGFLQNVGLGYLALDRTLRTLSGGEAQRVALTSALGSSLVNMLYVLDEPSVGLHPCDVDRLIVAVQKLRDRGNTVVAVEHEEAFLRAADWLIEIGPGAGDRGGKVTFQGTLPEMLVAANCVTGDFLAGRRGITTPQRRRPTTRGRIRLSGARGNNLKNITVDFPLGVLCLVTGVSGSGKSTLVQDTLYGALCNRKRKECDKPLPYEDVIGDGQIDDVVLVDQSPIGRSPRSNPVTYIKAFDPIRAVFAETLEARTHNYTAGHFSFNVEGGRCSECEGEGYQRIDMQFLPDVLMKCSRCGGTRYRDEILAVEYRGRNIAEVLEMTAREAFAFFRGQPKVQGKLKQLMDVGLDYLRLGQPATTLSSGESQRLKLAGYLSMAKRNRTLFLLDEPTTGLHGADVVQLLDCFEALLGVGHSLIVVEHNLQLMRAADHLIDLGPGAGDRGGQIVVQGTPEEVAACPDSLTGRFLAATLQEHSIEQTA